MAKFKITIYKEIPGYNWRNVYGYEGANIFAANSVALALANFEGAFLWDGATVVGTKVSPWPDPSGTGFIKTPLSIAGGITMSAPEPAEMCLLVDIASITGRPGKKWYRMSLNEADVVTVAGMAELVAGAGLIAVFNGAVVDLVAEMDAIGGDLQIGGGHLTSRDWANNMTISGVGFRDTDVGWYNKATEGP